MAGVIQDRRGMKEYQFFRLSTGAGFRPVLNNTIDEERNSMQIRTNCFRYSPSELVFLREFLRQLLDLFENRGLGASLRDSRRQGLRKREKERNFIPTAGIVLNLHSNEIGGVYKISSTDFLLLSKRKKQETHFATHASRSIVQFIELLIKVKAREDVCCYFHARERVAV